MANSANGNLNQSNYSETPSIALMIDIGAPYSEIVQIDLFALNSLSSRSAPIYDIPAAFINCPFWQYVSGDFASDYSPIIGYTLIQLQINDGNIINIRHLV